MKIVIAAGGGGHFSPALAVIQALPKGTQVSIIGRKYALECDQAVSLEYQTARAHAIPFYPITAARLQRKLSPFTIPSLLKFPYSIFQAYKLLYTIKPDVVVSFGGYVSVPVVIASFLRRIPIVIHEQTLEAGLANRISAFFANKICVSFPSSKKFFPKDKLVLTGNPMKKFNAHTKLLKSIGNDRLPIVYITGGSTGAHAINALIEKFIPKLLQQCAVIHQVGASQQHNDFDRLQRICLSLGKELQKRYFLAKFIPEMEVGSILKSATLVVSRAGVNTVLELLYFEKPSILIPLPYGQYNEQMKNATLLKNAGLAEIIDQRQATPEVLYDMIIKMLKNVEQNKINAKKALGVIIPNAAENVIQVIEEVAKK